MTSTEQTVDLLISHHQIVVRSRPFDEQFAEWGEGNADQGAILYPDYLTFDPLPDETFGANVKLAVTDGFAPDPDAARGIVAPFVVTDPGLVEVASAMESFPVEIDLVAGHYDVYFEICDGEDEEEEIYYRFTFVPTQTPSAPRFFLADEWGGEVGTPLQTGLF